MEIKRFEVNPFGENTYIIWDKNSGEAAFVDPGMTAGHEIEEVDQFVENNQLKPQMILLTHLHIDHTFGVDILKEQYQIPIMANRHDLPLGQARQAQANMFGIRTHITPLVPDKFVNDGDTLHLGQQEITVITTPGHSEGGVCYYAKDSNFILTGDTLFLGSVGRTDLPGGNMRTLINSITQKLLKLPPQTIVYPGHGPATTIRAELTSNPYLQ